MYFEGLLYAKHQEGCCGKDRPKMWLWHQGIYAKKKVSQGFDRDCMKCIEICRYIEKNVYKIRGIVQS